jgi:hypothetical protein
MDAELVNAIREKYAALERFLNERTKRLWAAVEAKALGRGGKAWVAAATQLSRTKVDLQKYATTCRYPLSSWLLNRTAEGFGTTFGAWLTTSSDGEADVPWDVSLAQRVTPAVAST